MSFGLCGFSGLLLTQNVLMSPGEKKKHLRNTSACEARDKEKRASALILEDVPANEKAC